VQAVLRQHWGLSGELCPLYTSAASRTWQVGGYVVKLARDEPSHFTAGLLASEAVERAGTKTGAPIRTIAGELCVPLPVGRRSRVVAVLHKIDVTRLPMRAVPPADLGQFLGGLHRILRGCPTAGAWTPDEVLGHIRPGIMDAHPPSVRQMIEQAASVGAYYDTAPPGQRTVRQTSSPFLTTLPLSSKATVAATTLPPRAPPLSRSSSVCASLRAPAT
jgi:Ser/Thr protein kinase RdoA (MazF antagonist)